MTKAQRRVLQLLIDGWSLYRHGRDETRGLLCRGKGEEVVVSSKTIDFLFGEGLISCACDGVVDFAITKAGREALSKEQSGGKVHG